MTQFHRVPLVHQHQFLPCGGIFVFIHPPSHVSTPASVLCATAAISTTMRASFPRLRTTPSLLSRLSSTLSSSSLPSQRTLTAPHGINLSLQRMDYAVRGALVQRAEQLAHQLNDPRTASSLPFSRIVYCNIGNPQSVQQPPITYIRQVLSAIVCPDVIKSPANSFPSDVTDKARRILDCSHGVGAYSESPGLPILRENVANAIALRDAVPSSADNIFLTNGASEAVKSLLSLIVRNADDGVMIPIPQYPLYSATMTALGGVQVPYYLDESDAWSLSLSELQRSLDKARSNGTCVRALVVINPGNPTGQVLSKQNLQQVVQFCEDNGLVILADEVYQKNVYVDDKPFVSFKKVVASMNSDVELASFHSVSKGVMGECGLRGGFVELFNMGDDVKEIVYKVLSVSLCSNVLGQAAADLMMTPPQKGDPSYDLYTQETSNIFNSLKRKSIKLSSALNTFEGVSCNRSEGAMYLFPSISISDAAMKESQRLGFASPDVLYCFEMLEQTGICVVPGSGFGQKEGTYHFRTTFLPPEDQIDDVADSMRRFHEGFISKYS